MKKTTWAAGTAVLVLVLGGAAVLAGWLPVPGMGAVAKTDAALPKEGKVGKKAEVTLEFAPRELVQPTRARLPALIEFSGPLVAPQTAVVRAKAGGTLLALGVNEGSRVQAGQVLGRIELAELNTRVAERAAMLESARATLQQAERQHASNERLAAQQFISANALETSRSAVTTASASHDAARAALATAQVGLREASLLAPISGIVAKRHAVPGEKVSVEQQLLTIVDLSTLELAGSIGTHEVARLAAGMPVAVQVEGVDQALPGRVARIAPAAEPGTRSIGVTIALANPRRCAGPSQAGAPPRGAGGAADLGADCTERLRAGQYALARATLADDTERLTLPASAVGKSSGQDHVWVIDKGLLARRAVTLGRRDEREGRVEVLQGVAPDSQVLAARFDNLREGAKAVVVAAKPAAGSAAASAPLVK